MENRTRWHAAWLMLSSALILALPAQGRSHDPCLKLDKIVPSYDALRQDNAIQLRLTFKASGCALHLRNPGTREDADRIRFGLQRTPGLTPRLKAVSFGKILPVPVVFLDLPKATSDPTSMPPNSTGAGELELWLDLQSSPDLAVGHYQISAFVQYEAMDSHNNLTIESLPFPLSFDVVPANAPVKQHFEPHPMTAKDVFLIPVRVVESFRWIFCGFCNY
jgi:hypothetical protein